MNILIGHLKKIIRRPALLFFYWAIGLNAEYILLGPYSYIRINDHLDSFLPRLLSLGNSIATNANAIWDPLFIGGIDRFANDMHPFHIASVIFSFLPPWIASHGIFIGSCWIAGWSLYLLCKKTLQLSHLSSLVAGALYAQALIVTDMLPFVLGFSIFPLTIYALERLIDPTQWVEKKCTPFFLAILLGIEASLWLSLPFTLPFTILGTVLWFVIVRKSFTVRTFALLTVYILALIPVHLPIFFSLLVNAPLSNRNGTFYQAEWLFVPRFIQRLLQNYWFLFILPALGWLLPNERTKMFVRTSLLSFAILFLSQMYQPFATSYGQYFTLIRDFGFDRVSYLIPLFAAVAAALFIETIHGTIFLKKSNKHYPLRAVIIFTIFILSIGIHFSTVLPKISSVFVGQGNYYANTHSPDLTAWLPHKPEKPFRVATITHNSLGLRPSLANLHGLETIDGDINIAPKRFANFFKIMLRKSVSDTEPKHSYYFFWRPPTSDTTEEDGLQFTETVQTSLLSLANVRYIFSYTPLSVPGWVLNKTPSSQSTPSLSLPKRTREKVVSLFQKNTKGTPLYIYENTDVLPRFFIVQNEIVFANTTALFDALAEATTTTLRQTVFLETSSQVQLFGTTSTDGGTVFLRTYSADHIELEVRTPSPSLLIVTNNYNPSWEATVNGVPTSIMPAYHTFMAIPISDSHSVVSLRYAPPYGSHLTNE